MIIVRVGLPLPDVWAGGTGVRAYATIERRTGACVFTAGGGVVVGGVGIDDARGAAGVPAGGVTWTPIFILKLFLPRYTTPSSPPPTGSATSTAFLSFSEGCCSRQLLLLRFRSTTLNGIPSRRGVVYESSS
jgi:hypothetical protein